MTRWGIGLAAVFGLPLLMAPKCFVPLEEPDAAVDAAPVDAAPPAVDDAGELVPGDDAIVVTPPAFVPAVSCGQEGEARLRIIDYSYQVECGCKEASGKTCTVPRGTKIVWQFGDAEEHNVASEGNGFGSSGERLTGTFSHVFDSAGRYGYGCTIHRQMVGYAIVVE